MLAHVIAAVDVRSAAAACAAAESASTLRAGSSAGSAAAMLRMHHARLRFRPSRCTSCGSLRSVTGRFEQRLGFAAGKAGQEPPKPGAKLGRRQHAPHQVGLDQARRKKSAPPGSHGPESPCRRRNRTGSALRSASASGLFPTARA